MPHEAHLDLLTSIPRSLFHLCVMKKVFTCILACRASGTAGHTSYQFGVSYALPSFYDGFSLAVLEAAVAWVP